MDVSNGQTNEFPVDSLEFKLLMAYSRKRRHGDKQRQQSNGPTAQNGSTPVPSDGKGQPEKKRTKKKNLLHFVMKCIHPKTEDGVAGTGVPEKQAAGFGLDRDAQAESNEEELASKLVKITDSVQLTSIPLTQGHLETDGEDDVVQKIVELLREHGDKLNEKMERDHALMQQLRAGLTYAFFTRVATTFLGSLRPAELPGTQSPEQTKFALTCEVTSRLHHLDQHPMGRVMGFGAKYLQENFSSLISNGGYEHIFHRKEEDDESDEEVH